MIWVYIVGLLIVGIGFSAFFGAPYVPSRRRDIKSLFDTLRPLTKNDVVLDLGSGDGIVLREVSARGAKAVGYEIHPLFVVLSRWFSRNDPRVSVRLVNGWVAPFPDDVTVVYIFSVGRDVARLKRKMQAEVNRIARPLTLICYGNPLKRMEPSQTFEAYSLYEFSPLHPDEP